MATNPSELPIAAAPASVDESSAGVQFATRWQAFRAGAWHGAKVGFRTFVIVMGLTGVPFGILMSFVPAVRADALNVIAGGPLILLILKGVGGIILFFVGFGTLCGAIPGALIAGIIRAVQWRPVAGEPKNG